MTVIVGLIDEGRVHIGGDSVGISRCRLTVRKNPKVFRNGPYALGFSGSFRMGQLLHHAFKAPTGHTPPRSGDPPAAGVPPDFPENPSPYSATCHCSGTSTDAVRRHISSPMPSSRQTKPPAADSTSPAS